jgi:hypothetical protein
MGIINSNRRKRRGRPMCLPRVYMQDRVHTQVHPYVSAQGAHVGADLRVLIKK